MGIITYKTLGVGQTYNVISVSKRLLYNYTIFILEQSTLFN